MDWDGLPWFAVADLTEAICRLAWCDTKPPVAKVTPNLSYFRLMETTSYS
jgi:hypothetical protein